MGANVSSRESAVRSKRQPAKKAAWGKLEHTVRPEAKAALSNFRRADGPLDSYRRTLEAVLMPLESKLLEGL